MRGTIEGTGAKIFWGTAAVAVTAGYVSDKFLGNSCHLEAGIAVAMIPACLGALCTIAANEKRKRYEEFCDRGQGRPSVKKGIHRSIIGLLFR